MASSGTYAFLPSNGEVILSAFERIQMRMPELRQEHFNSAYKELNLAMVKFGNLQPNLWKVELDSFALTQGVATYPIPAKVVMILDAYYALNSGTSNQTNRYMTPISRTIFASLAQPQSQGPPTQYWFDRLESPTVSFYPTPDGNGPYIFDYYACVQMQDANLRNGETPDIPYLWLDALVSEGAYRMARIYKPELEAVRKADAKEAWEIAAAQNTENVPFTLAPQISGYYKRG